MYINFMLSRFLFTVSCVIVYRKRKQDITVLSVHRDAFELAADYRWKAKGKNLWADKDDWFEAEDSIIED